jgi:AraC-like DNA-binding protein
MRSPGDVSITAPVDLAGRHPVVQADAATALAQAPCSLVSCLLWRTAADWSIPARSLDDLFLFLPVSGSLVLDGPGGREALSVGRLAIVPPRVQHAVAYGGRQRAAEILALHAHVTTAWGVPWPFPADRLVADLPDHRAWVARLERLAGLVADHVGLGAALGRGLVRQLLVEAVLAGHPVATPAAGLDPRLATIVARVQADPGATPAITDLARSQGVGPLRLRQLFHAGLGCSPKAFIDRLRLARAAEQLRVGRPVLQVARACGYGSIRQLQVRFKAAYGCTPSAWSGEMRSRGI